MQSITINPIVPGYPFTSSLQFIASDGSSPTTMTSLLTATQLSASVRAAPGPNGTLLATAVVVAISEYVLSFELAAADTNVFPAAGVYIDFARLDGTTWTPLPVMVRWPIRLPVTTNPALGVPSVNNPLGNLYYTQAQINALLPTDVGLAGLHISSALNSAGIGIGALYSLSTGSGNTAVGSGAGYAIVATDWNTFIGFNSGVAATGSQNTGVGSGSLSSLTTGDLNTGLGYNALLGGTTASYGIAIGAQAGQNLGGVANTAIGVLALSGGVTGSGNVALGYETLSDVTSGSDNVGIGQGAGVGGGGVGGANAQSTGSNNTFLGANTQSATPTQLSFATAIGAGAQVAQSNTIQLGRAIDTVRFGGTGPTTVAMAVFAGPTSTLPQIILTPGSNVTSAPDGALWYDGSGYGASLWFKKGGVTLDLGAVNSQSTGLSIGVSTSQGTGSLNSGNVVFGPFAMSEFIAGYQNTAIGSNAGLTLTGSYNVFVGSNAGYAVADGSYNVVMGVQAGLNMSTATVLSGGYNLTTGVVTLALPYGPIFPPGTMMTVGLAGVGAGMSSLGGVFAAATVSGQTSFVGPTGLGVTAITGGTITVGGTTLTVTSGAYNPTTGTTILTVPVLGTGLINPTPFGVGTVIAVGALTGSGSGLSSLQGNFAVSAIGGTVTYVAPTGAAITSITAGFVASGALVVGNTAIGPSTLQNCQSGQNTAVGLSALQNLTTGGGHVTGGTSGNTAFGYNAGGGITTGSENIAIGPDALAGTYPVPVTGSGNIGIGINALGGLGPGFENTAVGHNCAGSITTGNGNAAFGVESLFSTTTGLANVGIGQSALHQVTTGSSNTALGNGAGGGEPGSHGVSTGSNNTFLGALASYASGTDQNYLTCVGALAVASISNAIVLGRLGTDIVYAGETVLGPNSAITGAGATARTVATLPAASMMLRGARSFVTDAVSPTFMGTLTGGGSVVCPVFCNGTAWLAG